MKILVTGASGLIGAALTETLAEGGHQVFSLTRRASQNGHQISWSPDEGKLDGAALEGMDAVVHLAGENIAGGRWTPERKARIRDSRVEGTRLLCETLTRLKQKPRVLISASATGYYGHRGDEILAEYSAPGTGFLPEVSIAWEQATQPAEAAGIRTVILRIGMVLTLRGGALKKMLLPFKLGLGGTIGTGGQYMSWIILSDLLAIICYALNTPALSGRINAVAPNPVTNRTFTKALGHVLSRPTLFPLPAFAARWALGEMADALLLSSARVVPTRLEAADFAFRYPLLTPALQSVFNL